MIDPPTSLAPNTLELIRPGRWRTADGRWDIAQRDHQLDITPTWTIGQTISFADPESVTAYLDMLYAWQKKATP